MQVNLFGLIPCSMFNVFSSAALHLQRKESFAISLHHMCFKINKVSLSFCARSIFFLFVEKFSLDYLLFINNGLIN